MFKAIVLGAILLGAAALPASAAPQWGPYSPDAKFSDVFGRPVVVEKNSALNGNPSLGETASDGNAFLKQAMDDMLASSASVSSCQSLTGLKLPWVRIRSADNVAAEGETRAYCKVIGVVDKEITFEVDLPEAAAWNGKFLMGGGGGFIGDLSNGAKAAALHRGYATGATDTGHPVPADGGGSWADKNPERVLNWGHRGTHLAQANIKLVIQAYYKKAIGKSYYFGSSGSGRVALMEAERYANDFNGIIAACPVASWTKLNGVATTWTQQAMFRKAEDEYQWNPVLPPTKVAVMDRAIYEKCDALDGLKDGNITNPMACKFDPHVDLVTCKAGEDKPTCFTTEQEDVIAKIHAGPSNKLGQIYPGWPYGGENVPGMWAQGGNGGYVIGTPQKPGSLNPYASRHYLLTQGTLRYVVFGNPTYDLHSFNFDTDLPALQIASAQIDPDHPNLNLGAFNARHNKLIISVGWADWAVGGLIVKDFYDRSAAQNGGIDATKNFARLFMLPGVGHCFSTDAQYKTPSTVDLLTALENWVEKDQAPDSIIASHVVSKPGEREPGNSMPITGKVDRTRPICAYPLLATYNGKGNIDDAANFTCKAPAS